MNKYLLDTCSFLWMCQRPSELSERALTIMEDSDSVLFLSPVTTWEIAIKMRTAKNNIEMHMDLGDFVSDAIMEYDLHVLPLSVNHSIGVATLPMHHKCPFDRLLISISQHERSPIITCDDQFDAYDVDVVW